MKSNIVKIRVFNTSRYFINHLIINNINYNSLERKDNYYELIVHYDDYINIKKFYDSSIVKYYGMRKIKLFFEVNKYILLSCLWGILLLTILQNTIFDVKIMTEDKELLKVINKALIDNNIVKYKRKKSFEELTIIKEKILDDNKNILEWIEIKENGCNYRVDITKRVIKEDNNENDMPSNIVAKKDGLILYITSTSGTKLKSVNDYVKKGDILISGNVIKGESKIVNQVKAQGEVYAEVWYTVKVTVPFTYIEYEDTQKKVNHYYIKLFDKKFTILGKYDSNNVMSTNELILDKPYLFFKLYKEEKRIYKYNTYKVSEKEAYEEAIRRAENIINKTLNKDEYIISKNVLKKDSFSSKIYIEVFFKVYENIKDTYEIEKWVEENEGNNN